MLAALLEFLAATYHRALTIGEPVVLPDDEIGRVIERYKTHGQPRAAPAPNGIGPAARS